MKRLVAIAVFAGLFALSASAQRGGSHGGFSGVHGGGISAPHVGFSGGHGGFSAAPRTPSMHGPGGFVRGAPPRFSGFPSGSRGFSPRPAPIRPPGRFAGPGAGQLTRPPLGISHRVPYRGGVSSFAPTSPAPRQLNGTSHRMPYRGRGVTPFEPTSSTPRQLNGTSHRVPYRSPIEDRRAGGDQGGWDHRGRDRDRDRDHDHDGHHWHDHDWDRFGFYSVYSFVGYPYPYWPWWGWGYPFLNGWWDSPYDYDDSTQPAANYAASQYPEYAPSAYEGAQPEQPEAQDDPSPYSQPTPAAAQPVLVTPAPAPDAPVTLVFKDGRPNEQIRNYLLTSKTLSVLDRNRRDIPVDQIDLAATEKANRSAGVEFSIPGGGR